MPIATDGKGNWVTLDDSSGAWVPTSPPSQQQKGGGELGYAAAPPASSTSDATNVTQLPGGMQRTSSTPWFTKGTAQPDPPLPAGLAGEMPTLAGNLPSETPGTPAPYPPLSLTGIRDKIRELDMSAIRGLAPGPGASEPEKYLRQGVATGVHLGAGLLQTPLNMLLGMTQTPTLIGDNPDNAVTIDPGTGRLGVTPEALQAGSLGAGGLRFGGGARMPEPLLLPAPTPKPPVPPPAEAIPMPAPRPWHETAYDRGGQPPVPAFEPQVTMRQPEPPTPPSVDLASGVPTHELAPGGTSGPREAAPGGPPVNRSMPGGPDGPPAAVQPTPGSVGAAGTPTSNAAISTPDALVARAVAEKQKLLEQQQPGVPDLNQYVKDSNPTVAQIEQTVNTSREDKMLRNLNTDVSQEAREVADRNNTARQTHYAENAGSEYDVLASTQKRDAQLNTDIAAAFRNKGTADAQPVADLGQSILNGPDGKIDPVVRVVNNVMDKLRDKAGNLETDPETLWGVRKQINFLLSKEAAIENPSNATAARQLMQLRDAVDAAIEPAAHGFRAALKNYSDASRPIDAMELLQGREAKLYDSQNRMQYSKVQQMMKEAVAARHPDAPLNPWQSLGDDQMQKLWALRDDLRRSASAEDLARASGSDSVPNAIDIARQYAGVGLSSLPVLGPMAYRAKAALEPLLAARAARQQRARGMEMLYPNPEQYPLRNQVGP